MENCKNSYTLFISRLTYIDIIQKRNEKVKEINDFLNDKSSQNVTLFRRKKGGKKDKCWVFCDSSFTHFVCLYPTLHAAIADVLDLSTRDYVNLYFLR